MTLPKMTNYNVRSLFSKIGSLADDMKERESDLNFLTEVWEKKEKKKHQSRLEQLFEMHGIKYISTPRPGAQRGGGAAIAVRQEKFTISKLNIPLPKSLEVVWGLLRPKIISGRITSIIVCCFYSPPRSRKNRVLVDHITLTLQSLLKIHKDPGIIISGDRNSLDIASLLSADPSLRQIVKVPTRGSNILDIICTNLSRFYDDPQIIPPLQPDVQGCGAPSDHSGVLAIPNTTQNMPVSRNKVKKKIRQLPESLLHIFNEKLSTTSFNHLKELPVPEMVEEFQTITNKLFCDTFPQKEILISSEDSPWFTEELRKLKRQRQREYSRHGKSLKYLELANNFDQKSKTEIAKYKERVKNKVLEGRKGSTYPAIKRLGLRPGEGVQPTFYLPDHTLFSSTQSCEIIAEHFSRISQDYSPLNVRSLPPNIQTFLSSSQTLPPTLSQRDVLTRIRKAKKPNGLVPGDLPKKIVQVCTDNLAVPITMIYNKITQSAVYPPQWKIEHQLAIPKVTPPATEDDLRNIAKTSFFSKVYEAIIGAWLMPIIKPFLDTGQCGIKGLSITHYLIKLLQFVHSNLDLKKPHAVLAAFVDISKAFNRIDHTLVIQDLYDMQTPAWLLNIVISYLSDRSMHLTYNGVQSTSKKLPGGGPQGAYLGGLIFIIKYNGAFFRPPVPRPIIGPLNGSKSEKVKFVDDGSVAVSVDLKACLVPDPVQRPRPLKYHERTEHILPPQNNLLQYYVTDTEHFVEENKMVINKQKTKIMSFSKSQKYDFPPEIFFNDGTQIEIISQITLLGIVITKDLRWESNTEFICQKARRKLWVLRRLLNFELNIFELFDVYTKEVRSLLEMAVPVWHPGLTKKQSKAIESIQKLAFRIILQQKYINYSQACSLFSTETLESRRVQLCSRFALKNIKSENSMFTKISHNVNTRQQSNLVKEYNCNTKRYQKSSMPYLAKLLNTKQKK